MKFITKHWVEIITIMLSFFALGFSIFSHVENVNLQEKYNMLNTYGMTLNYQVKISDKVGEGSFIFDGEEIKKGRIEIVPKTGGIEKVYAIHYYEDNVKAILPIELYTNEIENKYDAQRLYYRLDEYTIGKISQISDRYYGTLYLVVKDYQNNYFTNMIVYEIEKENMMDVKIRIYSDIDLLNIYNKDNTLPEFDATQMKEYQNLKSKLDNIL